MAGIAGVVHRQPQAPRQEVSQQMIELMRHDSSWSSGTFDLESLRFFAGWVSDPSSSIKVSPAWNEDRTVCLIINGEEFNSIEEMDRLRARGHKIRGDTADTIVHWYEEDGHQVFPKLNGWYSGVLVNLRAGSITVFNDRYGLGRIYYHDSKDCFYFASEAKSILSVVPKLRRIDQRGLAEFLSVGCVMQNRSLFSDVSLLPCGSCWTFYRDGRLEKNRYFDPKEWEEQGLLDPETYRARLTEVFAHVLPRYTGESSQSAMSLTGGLDSRMILAWLQAKPGTIPCYTFGGPYRECADVRIARRLATACGQPHTVIQLENDFFYGFSSLAKRTVHLSDGAMDVSGAVELYVNERARAIAPIRLTGNYGSEILRSNVAFRPRRLDTSLFTPEFTELIKLASETYNAEASGHRLSFIAFKQMAWHHYARFSIEKSLLTPRSPFLDNDLVALAYRAPTELSESPEPLLRVIANGNPSLKKVPTDRALEPHSLPLLGKLKHNWQEFTAKAEYAYDYGMPTWLARMDRVMKPLHLEKLFLGRHKFYHFRVWYRDRLGPVLHEHFASGNQPSCYRKGAAQKLVEQHTSGAANRTLELHKLLTVQLVDRLLTGLPCPRT